MLYVICYDIADDRRRARIATVLERAGVRVQESVFEVRASSDGLEALLARLDRLRAPGDSVRAYALTEDGRRASRALGGLPPPEAQEFWLL